MVKCFIQTHVAIFIMITYLLRDNSIINSNSSVDHDSRIGKNCHVAPGVTVCGNVNISNNVFVGAGSIIINGINIGKNVIIPAGSTLRRDIKDNTKIKIKNLISF